MAEGVSEVLQTWVARGGSLGYGKGATVTSCFLTLDRNTLPRIWPLIIYPTWGRGGYAEVVFKHLATREPFDDVTLREELRNRLERIPGVHIPPSKIALRPSFPIATLAATDAGSALLRAMDWFRTIATDSNSAGTG